jgi:protein-disulfide isomerase
MNLKTFYGGLIGIAVVGGSALWLSSRQTPADATPPTTGPADTTIFPGYSMGSPNAPVEIVEYGDFVCPVCGVFAVVQEPDVRERLVQPGRVRWVFRDRPLKIPGHENAPVGHLAAACANEQGKFWEMHDQLYFNQAAWGEAGGVQRKLRNYAEAIHLDMDRYNACMDQQRYAARIRASAAAADQLGFTGTPTFVINGQPLTAGTRSYDALKAIVDSITAPTKAKSKS